MFQKVNYSVYQDVNSRNGRGECQLKIKARLNNREASFPTNIFVSRYQFRDEEIVEHAQASGLNAMVSKYIMQLQDIEIDAFKHDIDMTIPMLFSMYVEKISPSTPLVDFCDHVMKYCTNRRKVTKQKYRDVVREIDRFSPGVCLEDIDIVWLKKYESSRLAKGVTESTVWCDMKILRALFKRGDKAGPDEAEPEPVQAVRDTRDTLKD